MNFNQTLSQRQRKLVAAFSAVAVGLLTYSYSGSLTSKLPEGMQQAARLGLAGATVAVSYSTNSILKDNQDESGPEATSRNLAGASPPPPPGKNTKSNRANRRSEQSKGKRILASTPKAKTNVSPAPNGKASKISAGKPDSINSEQGKVTSSSKRRPGWHAVSETSLNEDGSLTVTITFTNISGNRFKQMVRNQLSGKFDAAWSRPKNLGNGLRSISATILAGENQDKYLASILTVTGAQNPDFT
ncbi:MAG: hypothetical protein IAF58_17450 [Leptolyngbya sp.]|nr:hypothetical protein [Candidatus Melainabacteria bacterium]